MLGILAGRATLAVRSGYKYEYIPSSLPINKTYRLYISSNSKCSVYLWTSDMVGSEIALLRGAIVNRTKYCQ